MNFDEPKILIFYSSPNNVPRLRLDIEHRAIDQVLRDLHLDSSFVHRLHATTIDDLTHALLEREHEIIQFSGHGNQEGFLLEDRNLAGTNMFISAKEIAYILHETSPHLKVAIFLSCFSADSIPELVNAASFVITVIGPADDSVAIDFISKFYYAYFRTGAVEPAFNKAQKVISSLKKDGELNVCLSRRAMVKNEIKILYQAFPAEKDDTILINLDEAEEDIKSLGVSREVFLGILSRKIRVHRWIFSTPRQRVILPLGPYFGLFSWTDANDFVTCHTILKVKESVDESTCEAWASLIVAYNNHYMDPYRTQQNTHNIILESALKEYRKTYEKFFNSDHKANLLRKVSSEQFKLARSAISSNLDMADNKFQHGDHAHTIRHLETALSAIHDLLDQLTESLTV